MGRGLIQALDVAEEEWAPDEDPSKTVIKLKVDIGPE
jgi:hypothetical protein